MKKYLSTLIAIAISSLLLAQNNPYFGFDVPTNAEVFAPSIISADSYERDMAISPDGTEIFYSIVESRESAKIVTVKQIDGVWQPAELASFSGTSFNIEPAFNYEGDKLFFASNRREDGAGTKDFDIWYVEKQADGLWSDPINVGDPINTDKNEFYPSLAKDGSLYYTANYTNGRGGEDIWYSDFENGVYNARKIVPAINSQQDEYNAFIDPDEQFIIFGSFGRDDDAGRGDLYIGRKDVDGNWQAAENMTELNSAQLDYSPYVSGDGKTLFFTSERAVETKIEADPFNINESLKALLSPQSGNIYWVKFL